MSYKTGKIWGSATGIIHCPFVEMNHIRVKPESYSSEHIHEAKTNYFYVLKGLMIIRTWKEESGHIDESVLLPGDCTLVNPNEYHQFITPKLEKLKELFPGWTADDRIEVIEVYTPMTIKTSDIKRRPGKSGGSLYTNP